MDRRSLFFAIGAVVALALYPLAPTDLHRVPLAVAVGYAVLSIVCWLDHRSR